MMVNCTLEESVGEYYSEAARTRELTFGAELDKIQAAICERPYHSRNHFIFVTAIVCMIISISFLLGALAITSASAVMSCLGFLWSSCCFH
jgi:hypothetical protein